MTDSRINTLEQQAEWPSEEGRTEARNFLRIYDEDGHDYAHQWLIKTRRHWVQVFNDEADMRMFSDAFNAIAFEATQLAM